MNNKREYDSCFYDTEKYCQNSPTNVCQHRGHLDKCARQQGCIVPEKPNFERKIIKK